MPILGSKYPFSLCWGKRTFHRVKKRSFRQNIDHIGYSFPFVYLIRLLHTLHWHFYSLLFIFYFTVQLLWAWTSRTETVMIPFLRYPPAYKKNTVLYEKKAETISKPLKNWLRLIIIFASVVHIFYTGMDGGRGYFLRARTCRERVSLLTVRWSSQQLQREAKGAKAKTTF